MVDCWWCLYGGFALLGCFIDGFTVGCRPGSGPALSVLLAVVGLVSLVLGWY